MLEPWSNYKSWRAHREPPLVSFDCLPSPNNALVCCKTPWKPDCPDRSSPHPISAWSWTATPWAHHCRWDRFPSTVPGKHLPPQVITIQKLRTAPNVCRPGRDAHRVVPAAGDDKILRGLGRAERQRRDRVVGRLGQRDAFGGHDVLQVWWWRCGRRGRLGHLIWHPARRRSTSASSTTRVHCWPTVVVWMAKDAKRWTGYSRRVSVDRQGDTDAWNNVQDVRRVAGRARTSLRRRTARLTQCSQPCAPPTIIATTITTTTTTTTTVDWTLRLARENRTHYPCPCPCLHIFWDIVIVESFRPRDAINIDNTERLS